MDLLLDVDSSPSMADKGAILALAVPDLVRAYVSPPCVDPKTREVVSSPARADEPCPAGSARRSRAVADLHVGVISSSLGGHGSDACAPSAGTAPDDRAHLLDRKDPVSGSVVSTYSGLGFLAWDPAQALSPPGEADLDEDSATDTDTTALAPQLRDLVAGVGQRGCGYPAQLEAWYRFLVDPSPPESLALDADGKVVAVGVDQALLDQRKAFLRPDSLVQIVMITDRDDCSMRETGRFYLAAQQKDAAGAPYHLPRARGICASSPDHACCFPCGETGPVDESGAPTCPVDPSCTTADGEVATLDDLEDNPRVRCFDQKRRFGVDFLYGVDRYVSALTEPVIADRDGEMKPNPLFVDLDPTDPIAKVRTADLVMLAGIVGVPWQDIARQNAERAPDLLGGLDRGGQVAGGFKTGEEMGVIVWGKAWNAWSLVAGAADGSSPPLDPLMRPNIEPRGGKNPLTGDEVAPPSSPLQNPMNGNERTVPARDDLQYACVFPLVAVGADGAATPAKRDCSNSGLDEGCDCADPSNDSPLCEVDPSTGQRTVQVRGKAYPGVRELRVLRALGSRAVVGSVCPAQMEDPARGDYGFRPALSGLTHRLSGAAQVHCMTSKPGMKATGEVACVAIEAVPCGGADPQAVCNVPARRPLTSVEEAAVDAWKTNDPDAHLECFCAIEQVARTVGAMEACQFDPSPSPVTGDGEPVDGYCLLDALEGIGDPALFAACESGEPDLLRFVGEGRPRSGAEVLVACVTEDPSCWGE